MNIFSSFLMALIPGEISYSDIKQQLKNMLSFKSSYRRCYVNKCSQKFRKFHMKTSLLESLLNKVAGIQVCNFIKKRLQHRYFPVKFAKFLRTPILKNIWERLLLQFLSHGSNVHYFRHRFINQKQNIKAGVHIFRKIKNKDHLKQKKKIFSLNSFQKILIFQIYLRFFRKCSIFRRSILLV